MIQRVESLKPLRRSWIVISWAAATELQSNNAANRVIPLLEKEGWMRRVKRGADGVVIPAKRFGRTDHPGASRHPSFSRRGKIHPNIIAASASRQRGRRDRLLTTDRNQSQASAMFPRRSLLSNRISRNPEGVHACP